MSNATSMTTMNEIISSLEEIQGHFSSVKNTTNLIRVEASQLNDAVRKIKNDLFSALKKCETILDCQNFMNEYVSKLQTTIDFNSVSIKKYTKTLCMCNIRSTILKIFHAVLRSVFS